MKRILPAAVILCGLGSSAHATLICNAPTQTVGANTGRNPVIYTVVWHDANNHWNAIHTLQDGTQIDRATQYVITDDSQSPGHHGWHGRLIRNPSLWMSGEVFPGTTGTVTYSETIYDEAHGNAVRMHSEAVCHRSDQPTSNPPVVAQAPAPAPASSQVGDSMPITVIGTHAAAPVVLGSMPVTTMIDTGCTDLSITQTIADRLIASGQATYAASRTYVLADGSSHENRTISIATITIGGHVLHDVLAGVDPDGAPLLLGFNVLQLISAKFSIDTAAGVLTFG